MGLAKWVWLGFLMGVVNFFKDGCGQAKKFLLGVVSPLMGVVPPPAPPI